VLEPKFPSSKTIRSCRIGLYSDARQIGGAERSMLNLASTYAGAHTLVVCSPAGRVVREAERLAPFVSSHLIPARESGIGAIIDHRRAFGSLRLDLVQVTLSNPFVSSAALLAAYSLRIPTVAVEQLVLPSRRRRGRWLKRVCSWPLSAHVAVGSASAAELHRFFGVPRDRITVIHNGVPDVPTAPTPFRGRPVIGCAARLEHQKALHLLIEAMPALPSARLVLVGDGSCRAALEGRAGELGVEDRVEFVGWVDDARPYIAGFDVFVLPSRDESFPLTIVEAMLAGTAVIASDVGSVEDAVVNGRTGILVPSGDVGALVDAITSVLDDVDRSAELASAARRHARSNFTSDIMAGRYDSLWTRLLESAGDVRSFGEASSGGTNDARV
jgi:glycosyltransferase involved in cell wall biosynthesis